MAKEDLKQFHIVVNQAKRFAYLLPASLAGASLRNAANALETEGVRADWYATCVSDIVQCIGDATQEKLQYNPS